jgi:hypothetical protein
MPLVDLRTNDKMAIVIQEILQDKIYLDTSGNLQTRGPLPEVEPIPMATYATVPVPLASNQAADLPPDDDLADLDDEDDEDE